MNLEVKNLRTRAGDYTVQADSLVVPAGELHCLVGESGSGKTTLLSALAGFLPLDAGTVRWDGRDLSQLPPERRGMAMVFQRPTLFPFLDVGGNVAFGLRFQTMTAHEREARAKKWLERVGLEALASRRPHQLSEGQAQRVALARALAVEFPVLLLDEPFSSLDPQARLELGESLRQLVKETRVAALLVSHHQSEVAAIASASYEMREGRLMTRQVDA